MVKITEVGQPCRNCKSPVVKAIPKKRDPRKAYWFSWYLRCVKCGFMFMVDSAKIENPDYKRKPDPKWQKDWIKNRESKQELNCGFNRNIS